MKKTVLTFGLISGAISSLMLFATIPFIDQIGFDKGMIVGYTTMVISFLMVFFGIRWYREEIGGGKSHLPGLSSLASSPPSSLAFST